MGANTQDRNRDERCERQLRRKQDDDPGQYGERRGTGTSTNIVPGPVAIPLPPRNRNRSEEMSEKGQRGRATRRTSGAPRAVSAARGRAPAARRLRDRHRTLQEIEQERARNFRPRTRPALVAPMLPLPAWKRSMPRVRPMRVTERDRAMR